MATDIPTGSTSNSSSKNLIVCIDGTSNQFGSSHTNVAKLCEAVDLESPRRQLVHYSSGIGTRMKEAVSDILDMAVAWSVDKNIKEAYGWLAEKYKEGDNIFLFGFSRGAYQVRVLAGMIHEVGLIRTRTEGQINRAYDSYKEIQSGTPEARYTARNFKKTFCWGDELTIHFIGVWDTVSSVGLSRGDVSLPMSSTACFIRHALALDECRVKFIPEYFRETSLDITSDDPLNVQLAHSSGGDQNTNKIKEVWFAGSHSDVGGVDRGKNHHAGNISLLWMRREAAERGLKLRPTDVTWGPDDIDFGTKNSMSAWWYIPEYISMKQQVSYGRSLKEAQRMHRSKPRLIMPHQKVHASILYADMYRPLATWARGFDMSMMHGAPENAQLDKHFWETDLFSDMEAQELVNSLSQHRLGAPESLERLLFMLQSNQGKEHVRKISDWQKKFMTIIKDRNYAPHVRLVAIVAYYEASCGPQENSQGPVESNEGPSEGAFKEAEECLRSISAEPEHRFKLTTIALLNSLIRHRDLQERFLTKEVLKNFVNLVDSTIATTAKGNVLTPGQRKNCIQVIKSVHALLQCGISREFIIGELQVQTQPQTRRSKMARLCHVLEVNDPHILVAVLRMVMTLARIQDSVLAAKTACSLVESRIRELVKKQDGIIGPLAIEIRLTLYGSDEQQCLPLLDARVRGNLASTFLRTDLNVFAELASIFGSDAQPLDEQQKKLIQGFTQAAASQKGDRRVRTTLTMTLLKLCEIPAIQTYLCYEIGLVGMFVNQLRGKKSALLAAYALATCLKHRDMRESIENNSHLPKHIADMLQLDYFDDAIGQVEGLTVLVYLMRNDRLRRRIMDQAMFEVLRGKAGKGQLKNIVTGLFHMDNRLRKDLEKSVDDYLRRDFEESVDMTLDMTSDNSLRKTLDTTNPLIFHNCTQELVAISLRLLQDSDWKTQKKGVTILTVLAQTSDEAKIVQPHIPKIIRMILPEKGWPIQPPSSEDLLRDSLNWQPRPASEIMGPACALQELQRSIRGTEEYRILTHIHVSRSLIAEKETKPWRVYTPTKCDVTIMLEKMIQAVEEDLLGRDLMRIGDTLPPALHREHALMLIGYTAVGTAFLPVALGASCVLSPLAVTAALIYGSVYLAVKLKEELDEKIGYLPRRVR